MVFIMVFILVFISGVLLIAFTGIDGKTSLLCVITTLCNIGSGLQLAGHTNYAWLPDSAKWILSFCMLAGRLELYAVLMLFLPAVWKK
jgi:trk system potassium uptake protein TrkH